MGACRVGLFAAVNLVTSTVMMRQAAATASASAPKVVVVGNGPSGMTMAGVLAGWRPFYVTPHPHPDIHAVVSGHIRDYAAAMSVKPGQVSVLDLDLPGIAMELGLRGRSNNPVVRQLRHHFWDRFSRVCRRDGPHPYTRRALCPT